MLTLVMTMASITPVNKRKGLVSGGRRDTLGMAKSGVSPRQAIARQVSPSLSSLHGSSHSSTHEKTIQSNDDSGSISHASSQEIFASVDRDKENKKPSSFLSTDTASSLSSDSTDSLSSCDSMETLASSCSRPLKQATKWYFKVGEYADKRSYGAPVNNASRRWSRSDFDIVMDVGKGCFGRVFLAIDTSRQAHVALKKLRVKKVLRDGFVECLRNEVEIQTRLQHENILQSFGYFRTSNNITLVLEYAPLGNLFELKNSMEDGKLPLDLAQRFIRQVASALAYLYTQNVAHRDVKGENAVICSNTLIPSMSEATAKLCDFGYAVRSTTPNEFRTTFCGTPEFVPPEMLMSDREYVACHVDTWALGVLAYELVMGRSPFYLTRSQKDRIASKYGYKHAYKAIFVGIEKYTLLERPADCNETVFDFISLLMQHKPHRRMSAVEALEHPWLCESTSRTEAPHCRSGDASRRAAKRAKTSS